MTRNAKRDKSQVRAVLHVTSRRRVELRRRLVASVDSGPTPWAEFVDALWLVLAGRAPQRAFASTVGCWRVIRGLVVGELVVLGLAVTVQRTDRAVPLARHDTRVAGLVVVHRAGSSSAWADTLPPTPPGWPDELGYAGRMAQAHGLVPAEGVDRDPYRFCGQARPHDPPPWADHARIWLDRTGELVLSVEPYQLDAAAFVRELGALPLVVDGPHPGVRSRHATLLLLRHNPAAEPLPADPIGSTARRR